MNSFIIRKEQIDPETIALQQSKAIIVGSQVIYVTYEPLIDMEQAYLLGEFE